MSFILCWLRFRQLQMHDSRCSACQYEDIALAVFFLGWLIWQRIRNIYTRCFERASTFYSKRKHFGRCCTGIGFARFLGTLTFVNHCLHFTQSLAVILLLSTNLRICLIVTGASRLAGPASVSAHLSHFRSSIFLRFASSFNSSTFDSHLWTCIFWNYRRFTLKSIQIPWRHSLFSDHDSTVFLCSSGSWLKWYGTVAPSINGLTSLSKDMRVNHLKCSSTPLMLNRNRNTFRFSLFKNAFCKPASRRWVETLARIKMSHNKGCSGEPVCMHSLTVLARGWSRVLASNTILTFVVEALCLIMGLCGM